METKNRKKDLKEKDNFTDKNQNLVSHIAKKVEIKEKMRLKKMILI